MKLLKKLTLNKEARTLQNKIIFGIGLAVAGLIFLGCILMSSDKHQEEKPKPQINMSGAVIGETKAEFNGAESNAALQAETREVDMLKKQLTLIQKQIDSIQKNTPQTIDQQIIQNLQNKIENLTKEINTQPQNQRTTPSNNGANLSGQSIGMINFSYNDETTNEIKNKVNYVPPGTFAKAVLLSGADTNAGTSGQTDTLPIIMRILDNGVLPNGEHSSLKDCFITAAAYGDPSSERGQIRLQRLSCVRQGGRILDTTVEGTVSDMGGNDGIRGHIVMRNGKLLWNAGLSGLLSGIGSAMQQSLTTQASSPLGTTSTVPPGKVLQYGVFGGANTAMQKIADYYIKLAELYHPIVQIHAGSNVDVVFLKGFSLDVDHNQLGLSVTPKIGLENSQQSNISEQERPNISMPTATAEIQDFKNI